MRRLDVHWLFVALVCATAAAVALLVPDIAFAQDRVRGGPAPLLGIGLPLLGGVVVAAVLVHRLRRKD